MERFTYKKIFAAIYLIKNAFPIYIGIVSIIFIYNSDFIPLISYVCSLGFFLWGLWLLFATFNVVRCVIEISDDKIIINNHEIGWDQIEAVSVQWGIIDETITLHTIDGDRLTIPRDMNNVPLIWKHIEKHVEDAGFRDPDEYESAKASGRKCSAEKLVFN